MQQQQGKHDGAVLDNLQIELLFNSSSWENKALSQIRFSSHGITFLSESLLFYSSYPIPYGNLFKKSTILAHNVLCFSSIENDEALYFVLVLMNGDLAICVLEEILDVANMRSESKSSLKLRLLHSVTNLQQLGIQLIDNILPVVTFISDLNYITFEQNGFVSVIRYDAEAVPDQPSVGLLLKEMSMENDIIRRLLLNTEDSSQLNAIWKNSSGQVSYISRLGYSNHLHILPLHGLDEGLDAKQLSYKVSTTHGHQISAISTSPNSACEYALTGDVDGCILLWKYYIQDTSANAKKVSSKEPSQILETDTSATEQLPTAPTLANQGKWEIVLEEISFCEHQCVTFVSIDPRNLFAYIGDKGGRLSIAQISSKSNHMHLIHELYLFPIAHGPSSVFVIPASSLPTSFSSASAYLGNDTDSISKKSDPKSVLVQCYCASTGEALQVHVSRGIASIMRVSASTVLPCDRGNEKIRSERPDSHLTFPAQDTTTVGNTVIDRSLVLPALNIIVTVDWLGIVQLWDIATCQLLHHNVLPSHHATCLAGSDGHCWTTRHRLWLCTGHQTGAVHIVSLSVDPQYLDAQAHNLKESSEVSEMVIAAAAAAAAATTPAPGELPAVFDLLQEDSEEDDEDENSVGEGSVQKAIEGGGEDKIDASNEDNDEFALDKGSLAEGSIGSIGTDSMSTSFVSLYGHQRQRNRVSETSQLPLLWQVEFSVRPNRLPATDVFFSEFGEQLVCVHGKRNLQLYRIDKQSPQQEHDILPQHTTTTDKSSGQKKQNSASLLRPTSERKESTDKEKSNSATTAPATNKPSAASTPQRLRRLVGSSTNQNSHSNAKKGSSDFQHAGVAADTEDHDFDLASMDSSLSAGAAPLRATTHTARMPTTSSSKRPVRSLTLDFTPLHITILQKQLPSSNSSPPTAAAGKMKNENNRTKNDGDDTSTVKDEEEGSDEEEDISIDDGGDRLWLVLQKSQDTMVILDALKMEFMTEIKLSPIGQEIDLRVSLVWDCIDRRTLQTVLMGLCALSPTEWFEFNEVDGLKPVLGGYHGNSFHQSTYSNVRSASQVIIADSPGSDKKGYPSQDEPFASPNKGAVMPPSTHSLLSKTPVSILESELVGVESYRMDEAPIVVGWSLKACVLVRLQLLEANRVTVTRMKRYELQGSGLLQDIKRNRLRVLTGKALRSSVHVRNHRVVVVLSNGFAVVLHL